MKVKEFLKEHKKEVLLSLACFSLGTLWMKNKETNTIGKAVNALEHSTDVTNKAVNLAEHSVATMTKIMDEAK